MFKKVKVVSLFLFAFFIIVQFSDITHGQNLFTPEGVLFMKNKSFDDSKSARQEILDLYKGLRLTDVCDGMDGVGIFVLYLEIWNILNI